MPRKLKKYNIETYHKKRGKVTLEQKIEIFERFAQTGEKLAGNTVFEGYPIGRWATQIRTDIKRVNSGKINKIEHNLGECQLEKLESLGVLERQIDATLDEKIDAIIEWKKNYPKALIAPVVPREVLMEYVKTEEEYKNLSEKYKKMQRYYEYIRGRKSKGKLSKEQILKCKEGKIGGVFGGSSKVEELSVKYDLTQKDAEYILTQYDSIDNFYEVYKQNKIVDKTDLRLKEKIIKDVVDIDSIFGSKYDKLIRKMIENTRVENELILYSSRELKEALNKFKERDLIIIEKVLGFEGEPETYTKIGNELGVTHSRIGELFHVSLRMLRESYKYTGIISEIKENELITEEERNRLDKIVKDIQLQNGDIVENLKLIKSIKEEVEHRSEKTEYVVDGIRKTNISSYKIDMTRRTRTALTRAGIRNLDELSNMTYKELLKINRIGKTCAQEIVEIMHKYGIPLKNEIEQVKEEYISQEEKEEDWLDKLGLSKRARNCLTRAGIKEFDVLANMTYEDLLRLRVRNFGIKCAREVFDKMQMYKELIENEQGGGKQQENTISEEKQEIIGTILEKQKIISEQEAEISRLTNKKKEL